MTVSSEAAPSTPTRVQVLIAGGGPVGMVAAYALARHGISVHVLESAATIQEDMRASTFHPPTLEMMAKLGLLDELEAVGLKAPVYQYANRASGQNYTLDMGDLADSTPHPYRLQCEQFKLVRLISAKFADMPCATVEYGRRLVHFEQDATGVTATAEGAFDLAEYRADYLIGADGANSLTRKWLGVGFDGFTYPESFLTLSTAYPIEQHLPWVAGVNYVADPPAWCVLLRVPGLWRILVPQSNGDSDGMLLGDARKNEVFRQLLGPDAPCVETNHRTIYRVHQRVAKAFRVGRVLLAGDSAHLNNPLGGFGMNSGIHDAWNLADKLVEILGHGGDADALLDRYDRQRRTITHGFVQAQTIANKKALESEDGTADRERALAQAAAGPAWRAMPTSARVRRCSKAWNAKSSRSSLKRWAGAWPGEWRLRHTPHRRSAQLSSTPSRSNALSSVEIASAVALTISAMIPLHRPRCWLHGGGEVDQRQCRFELAIAEDRHRDRRGLARRQIVAAPAERGIALLAQRIERLRIAQEGLVAVLARERTPAQRVFPLRLLHMGEAEAARGATEQRQREARIIALEGQRGFGMRRIEHHHVRADLGGDRHRPADLPRDVADKGAADVDELVVILIAMRERAYERGGAVQLARRLLLDQPLDHESLHDPARGRIGHLALPRDRHHRQGPMPVDRLENGDGTADGSNGNALFHVLYLRIMTLCEGYVARARVRLARGFVSACRIVVPIRGTICPATRRRL